MSESKNVAPAKRSGSPFRLLIVIYVPALVLGAWEFYSSRSDGKKVGEVDWYGVDSRLTSDPSAEADQQHNSLEAETSKTSYARTIQLLYPNSADADVIKGVQAGSGWKDVAAARERFEQVLARGVKHHEDVFYYYVLLLLHEREEAEAIDQAIANWRRNFPRSARPIYVPFTRHAFEDNDEATRQARLALAAFKWIVADSVQVDPQESAIRMQIRTNGADIVALRAAMEKAGFMWEQDWDLNIGLP